MLYLQVSSFGSGSPKGRCNVAILQTTPHMDLPYGRRPKDIIRQIRPSGRSCGTGPYFRYQSYPYLGLSEYKDPWLEKAYFNTDGWFGYDQRSTTGYMQWCCVGPDTKYFVGHDQFHFMHHTQWVVPPRGIVTFGTQLSASYLVNGSHHWLDYCEFFISSDDDDNPIGLRLHFRLSRREGGSTNMGVPLLWDPTQMADAITGEVLAQLEKAGRPTIPVAGTTTTVEAQDPITGEPYWATMELGYVQVYRMSGSEPSQMPEWQFDEGVETREDEFMTIMDLGIIPGRVKNAVAQAYEQAVDQLPDVSANSVANILEISGSLVTGAGALRTAANLLAEGTAKKYLGIKLKKGIKSLSKDSFKLLKNGWLSWRYVYNTTKMDIEDYRQVTNRLIQLVGNETFKISGRAQGDGFSIKATRTLSTSDYDLEAMNLRRKLEVYGLKLSAYNIWDMIPFSFMVDWFLHVGDAIERAERYQKSFELKDVDNCWSLYEKHEHGHTYYRVYGVRPTQPALYTTRKVKGKTIAFRFADAVSIFTSR